MTRTFRKTILDAFLKCKDELRRDFRKQYCITHNGSLYPKYAGRYICVAVVLVGACPDEIIYDPTNDKFLSIKCKMNADKKPIMIGRWTSLSTKTKTEEIKLSGVYQ